MYDVNTLRAETLANLAQKSAESGYTGLSSGEKNLLKYQGYSRAKYDSQVEDINLPYYLKYSGLTSMYDASGFNSEGSQYKGLEALKGKNTEAAQSARALMSNIWEYYDIMNKLDEDNNQVDPNGKMSSKDRSRLESRAGALRGSIDAAKRGYSALDDDTKGQYEY